MKSPPTAALLALAAVACTPPQRIDVVAAASLRPVLEEAIAAIDGEAQFRLQTGGSTALARRVAELDLNADLVALADGDLFDELLGGWAPYWVAIASERLVIAHTDRSAGAAQVNARNWPEVLQRPDVEVGLADPDLAPVGYRTLLALQLWDLEHPESRVADRLLAAATPNLRPDVAELLAPLQAGAIDYAFLYASTARLAGLQVVELPAGVNLGHPDLAGTYAQAAVEVAGRDPGSRVTRRGAPILYGAAVRPGAPTLAEELLRWLLGAEGRAALQRAGFALAPVTVHGRLDPAWRARLGLSESSSAPR